jgi:uncharacterized damage-inducible protein DinB
MASTSDLLVDALGRIRDSVHGAVDGLSDDDLSTPIAPSANTITWLVWHLSRLIDDHLADARGVEQLWTRDGWRERFGLPFDVDTIGYGQSVEEAQSVRASAELLGDYHDAVQDFAVEYVGGLTDDELDRVVDDRWEPPVTLAVRLISVVNDCAQHVGQAAYVRGLLT